MRHVTRKDDLARLQAMPLNERIRLLRNRRKLSHDAYAELIGGGLRRWRVIAWEKPPGAKGHSGISQDYAKRLANLEKLPVELFRSTAATQREAVLDLLSRLEARVGRLEKLAGLPNEPDDAQAR